MTDYSVLQAQALDFLNRDDTTAAQVDTFINLAEKPFNRKIIVPARELTATSVTTTNRVTLPADFWAMRAVYVSGQVDPELTQMSLVDLVRLYSRSGASTGDLRHYAVSGTELVLGPTPGSSTTITLVYYQTIPALTSSATSNWLSLAHPDLYLAAVLAEAYVFYRDAEGATIWENRTLQKIEEVIKAGRRKTSGSAPLRPQGPATNIRNVRA